ncbi:hypothetical protein RF11_03057 [Thelohanellus kitauei]|uniref:Uncharacterized protein n=1 Tax=Thelohanellus kitauei TaxID=669202 RepID=A0A0C2MNN8_THEKT|nr:hypothetical protein RF11_03057 [Thelohanellus kitauei]
MEAVGGYTLKQFRNWDEVNQIDMKNRTRVLVSLGDDLEELLRNHFSPKPLEVSKVMLSGRPSTRRRRGMSSRGQVYSWHNGSCQQHSGHSVGCANDSASIAEGGAVVNKVSDSTTMRTLLCDCYESQQLVTSELFAGEHDQQVLGTEEV